MGDSDRKNELEGQGDPPEASPESLQESLAELAENVDALVDRLTMDMRDTPVTEGGVPPSPETAVSPRPEQPPVASAAKEDATVSIDDDQEIVNLAGEMIEAVAEPAAAETAPSALESDDDSQADRLVDSLLSDSAAAAGDPDETMLSLDLDGDSPRDEIAVPEAATDPPAKTDRPEPEVGAEPEVEVATESEDAIEAPAAMTTPEQDVVPWSDAPPTPALRRGGGNRWMWIAAGVALVVGTGLTWMLLSPGGSPAESSLQAVNRAGVIEGRNPVPSETTGNPAFPAIAGGRGEDGVRAVTSSMPDAAEETAPDDKMPAAALPEPTPTPPTPEPVQGATPAPARAAVPARVQPVADRAPPLDPPAPVPASAPPKPKAETTAKAARGPAVKADRPVAEPEPTLASGPVGNAGPPAVATAAPPPETTESLPRPEEAKPDPSPAAEEPTETAVPVPRSPAFAPPEAPVMGRDTAPRPRPRPTTPAGTTGPAIATAEIEPPHLVSRQEPIYPPRARKRGEGGVVELRILVNEHGRVVRVVVEEGIPGSELEARAIDAALRSTYEPATRAGETVRAWVTERFLFEP